MQQQYWLKGNLQFLVRYTSTTVTILYCGSVSDPDPDPDWIRIQGVFKIRVQELRLRLMRKSYNYEVIKKIQVLVRNSLDPD